MTVVVWILVSLVFMSCSVMVSGYVLMFVVYLELLNVVCFLDFVVCLCIVSCVMSVMDVVKFRRNVTKLYQEIHTKRV